MPNLLKYHIQIGPQHDLFGLVQDSPQNPILVADNKSSDFILSEMRPSLVGGYTKRISSISSSARKTRILSNTTDVRMTNVFNDAGDPLYFKTRRQHSGTVIHVNGEIANKSDSNFIYINSPQALVEYFSADGRLLLSNEQEVYPMFIWENQVNHNDIMEMDKRRFYYRESKGSVVLIASKTGVVAEVDIEPVFTPKRLRQKTIEVPAFIFSDLRTNERGRLSFEYDYLTVVPNVVAHLSEQISLRNNDYMLVKNVNVIKRSLVIYKVVAGVKEVIIDNLNGQLDNLIDSSLGRVYAISLLEDGIIEFGDIIYVDYQSLEMSNIIKVQNANIPLRDVSVHFRIRPTRIHNAISDITFTPKVSYVISDSGGNVVFSVDDDLPVNDFSLPTHLGFGQDGYGTRGFGGVIDDFSLITITSDGLASGTAGGVVITADGYSADGFGEGPFGGSHLRKLSEIANLLDAQNNSESGTIEIGSLSFFAKVKNAHIFPYLQGAKNKYVTGHRSLYSYANVLWNVSLDNRNDDTIDTASTITLNSFSTIDFAPTLLFRDSSNLYIQFDLSPVSSGLTTTAEVDPSLVLTAAISPQAYQEAQLRAIDLPSNPTVFTHLVGYTYTGEEYIELSYPVQLSSDMTKATIALGAVDLLTAPSNIGLGYRDGDLEIYPARALNI